MDGKLIILGHGFMRSVVSEYLSFIDFFEQNLGKPCIQVRLRILIFLRTRTLELYKIIK